jgi:hypothetical protein
VYCPRCRAALERQDRRCWACGRRLGPSFTRPALYTVIVAALAVTLVVGANRLWAAADERGDAEAARKRAPATTVVTTTAPTVTVATTAPAGATTAPPAPAPVKAASVAASAQTGPAQNGCAQVTGYEPANVQDGNPATAWRSLGDGTGQTLQLTLAAPTHLTQVGLIPGYDKIDDCTSADRFAQMRKITAVRWSFGNGATVDQTFTPDRTMQVGPVDVVTSAVTVEILGTTPPGDLDYTPISEIALVGYPA